MKQTRPTGINTAVLIGIRSKEAPMEGGPAQVRQVTPRELQEKLQSDVKLELFDVRTPEERDIARIEGARLLDAEVAAYIGTLPRDTLLVFHCHHGIRSQ